MLGHGDRTIISKGDVIVAASISRAKCNLLLLSNLLNHFDGNREAWNKSVTFRYI